MLVGSAVGCDDNSPLATTTLVDSSVTALSARAALADLATFAACDNNSYFSFYFHCHTLSLEISKKS